MQNREERNSGMCSGCVQKCVPATSSQMLVLLFYFCKPFTHQSSKEWSAFNKCPFAFVSLSLIYANCNDVLLAFKTNYHWWIVDKSGGFNSSLSDCITILQDTKAHAAICWTFQTSAFHRKLGVCVGRESVTI